MTTLTPRLTLASLTALFLVGGLPVSPAGAEVESFPPIKDAGRTAIFAPTGIEADEVKKAKVKLLRRHGAKKRRLRTHKVRDALTNSTTVTVSKRRRRDEAERLIVKLARPAPTTGCEFGAFSGLNLPGPCWRPYSDRSPFNRELPANVRQAPRSAEMAQRVGNYGGGAQIVAGVADSGSDYEHPLFYSQPGDPTYTIHCIEYSGRCEIEGMQVRIPVEARPAGGADHHLAVIDQASGWEYDLYNVQGKPSGEGGQLTIGWGGRTEIGTPDATGLDSNATAAHFGLAAGVIRPAELETGEIDHALVISVKCTNGTSVRPAGTGTGRPCTQLGLPNAGAPPMGSHFYLDMTEAEIAAADVTEWERTIMTAMARYGAFIEDTGADYNGWAIKVESGTSYTAFGQPDPWVELGKKYNLPNFHRNGIGQLYVFDLQDTVDWKREFAVADPCVSAGTC